MIWHLTRFFHSLTTSVPLNPVSINLSGTVLHIFMLMLGVMRWVGLVIQEVLAVEQTNAFCLPNFLMTLSLS